MSIIDPIKLKNMTAGDDDLVADLAIMFVRKLPELKAQMRIGIETGDADAVESGAHQLKSRVSYFGATSLHQQSSVLEAAARENDRQKLAVLHDSLFADVDKLIQELRTLTSLSLELDTE